MIYVVIAALLSLWAAFIGAAQVLNRRLFALSFVVSIVLAYYVGLFSCATDWHFDFECQNYKSIYVLTTGLELYEGLFMKNWALSIIVIAAALLSYELSKVFARRYKASRSKKHVPLAQRIQDLP